MTITELKHLYHQDLLAEAIIEPSELDGGWVVEFRHKQGGFLMLTDIHGAECQYVDLDKASKSALAVGFSQVRIEAK
ncbi:thymidylate kinase [Vibrio methylphosphonaticus]|uniref:thymidylate kinase n=1 Tax=Vibrio methylphosphonaticus TaxID=2946866 RepID=UPI00202A51CA|nr:thymidylate kinase [Vibrio methylphosphonaticus]MCL9777043.1 thymidylate kinase [Vibrio methylphosphonaticus]